MKKVIKKATALLLVAIMAFTPVMVNAEEVQEPFAATTQLALEQAAILMDALSVAGMTIAIVDIGSDFVWLQGLGYANAATQEPVTEYTLFSIGSTAKVFTAVAIMQLVEQGLLCLDEPITTYLPNFSVLPNPAWGGDYRNVTTRMLLTHTSGMHELLGVGASIEGQDRNFYNEMLPILANMHMQNVEMDRMTYNNTGYALLGLIVAAFEGNANYFDGFVNFTQENIFAPAGMVSSSFEINDTNRANLARPHADATTVIDEFLYISMTSIGGMVSNAHDMARFMQVMLSGGGDILSPESVQAMAVTQDLGIIFPTAAPPHMQMGLGIMHLTRPDGVVQVGHGGNLQHHTEFILDFYNGIGVFVSGNSAMSAVVSAQLGELIWRTAVYEKTGAPVVATAVQADINFVTDIQRIAGWYTSVGELVIGSDGLLHFAQIPGLSLAPAGNGTFDSIAGTIWFEEIGGIIFMMAEGAGMQGERITPMPAPQGFDRWVGNYGLRDADGNFYPGAFTISIDANGFVHGSFSGMSFVANVADDYTIYFPGRSRMFGSVGLFSLVDGVPHFSYSGDFLEMMPALELVRFVVGNAAYTIGDAPHAMDATPFVDTVYNRTMVPLSFIEDIFNTQVAWDSADGIAYVLAGANVLAISASESLPNGMGRAHYVNGSAFVPLVYVANALGAQVIWDGATQAVYVVR